MATISNFKVPIPKPVFCPYCQKFRLDRATETTQAIHLVRCRKRVMGEDAR